MKKLIVVIGENALDVYNYAQRRVREISDDGNETDYYFVHKWIDSRHPMKIRDILRNLIETYGTLVLTTDSPYVLGEINNILYARNVAKANPDKAEEIKAIIPEKYWIEKCEAWEIVDGKPVSIYEEDINLIRNEAIDEASRRLNDEFDKISDFEV